MDLIASSDRLSQGSKMSGPSGSSKAAGPSVNGWNAEYLDQQYAAFKRDPSSVPADMVAFFQGFDLGRRARGLRLPPREQGWVGRWRGFTDSGRGGGSGRRVSRAGAPDRQD